MAWDSSKGFWANVGGGIADNTVERIPGWDESKGFWENTAGGIADNTVERIPGWDESKGVTENIVGGTKDVLTEAAKTVSGVGTSLLNGVKRYWYVPVIIGGAVVLVKVLKKDQAQDIIRALAASRR